MTQRTLAAVGDLVFCPGHGMTKIVTGWPAIFWNHRPAAAVGHQTSCGATIITGAPAFRLNGQPAAREGDRTDHGGTILRGPYPIYHDDGAEAPMAEALANAAALGQCLIETCPATDPDAPDTEERA